MTTQELRTIKGTLAELRKQMPLGFNDSETAVDCGDQLVAEVERYRDFVVVDWGDSPIAKFIAACDALRVIVKQLRDDGDVALANSIEKHVSVIQQYHGRPVE